MAINSAENAQNGQNSGKAFPARWDVVVVGGGPAGLAAALAARENGAKDVLILERNDEPGGILNQCIHNGFGLQYFGQELTGPEYAERFTARLAGSGITLLCGAMVLEVYPGPALHAIHPQMGYLQLDAAAIVLAMGCRERPRGAIGIPGTRPAGILTAGAAQLYINIEGLQMGRRAVVLGSGDIGLIMARRLTLEGAKVLGVYELLPYSSGLSRNKVQCLDDFGIPLHLSHTIVETRGEKRLEQVVVQQVDEHRRPLPGTQQVLDCDTLLLSVGLIPENELTRRAGVPMDPLTGGAVVYENMETLVPGIFACGNVAHVHDIVDMVSAESARAGAAAARRCAGVAAGEGPALQFVPGEGLGYTLPQRVRPAAVEGKLELFFRPARPAWDVHVEVWAGQQRVARFRRERLAPGEMETLTLPKTLLEKIPAGSTVRVDVQKEAAE